MRLSEVTQAEKNKLAQKPQIQNPTYSDVNLNAGSIYSKGGEWDMKNRLGSTYNSPKVFGVPIAERALSGAIAGIPSAVGGAQNVENVLPMMGQVAGSYFGGYPGSIVGATTGQALRQGVRGLRGMEVDLMSIPIEAGLTAAFEGVSRLIPKVAFWNQYGNKAKNVVGEEFGKIQSAVNKKAPFIRFSKNDIIQRIDDYLLKNKIDARSLQATALRDIRKYLMDKKGPLSFDEMVRLERKFREHGTFAKSGGVLKRSPKSSELDRAIKIEGSRASAKVDEAAHRAGFPNWESVSKKFSKLAERFPKEALTSKVPSLTGLLGGSASGLALGYAPMMFGGSFNPYLALAGGFFGMPPYMRTQIFNKAIDKPITRAFGQIARPTITEVAREGYV